MRSFNISSSIWMTFNYNLQPLGILSMPILNPIKVFPKVYRFGSHQPSSIKFSTQANHDVKNQSSAPQSRLTLMQMSQWGNICESHVL